MSAHFACSPITSTDNTPTFVIVLFKGKERESVCVCVCDRTYVYQIWEGRIREKKKKKKREQCWVNQLRCKSVGNYLHEEKKKF